MKIALLCLYGLVTGFTYWLRHINLRHLARHGTAIPEGFEGEVDAEKLRVSTAYTVDSSRAGLWESLFDNLQLLAFLFCGLLPLYDGWVSSLSGQPIISAICFFLALVWVQALLGIPFDLYSTFRIEAKYGFNTTTPRLWCADFFKSQLIGSLLLAVVLGAVFWLIRWSPERWWIWCGLLWRCSACS